MINKPGLIYKTFILLAALILPVGLSRGQSLTFTTTGNNSFTVPAGVTSIIVEAWGGGGGAGTRTTNGAGGGAGGGAYVRSTVTVVPGFTYTNLVVVGAGGAAGNNGGNSSFNTNTVVAAGGSGVASNTSTGGAGGSAGSCVGSIIYAGGNGGNGTGVSNSGGGGGGAGSGGAGGNASGATAGTGTAANGGNGGAGIVAQGNGNNGSTYGGGGSGGLRTTSNRTGGTGAQGMIVISWTQPVFYSQSSGDPGVLSNWNTNPSGGGYSPTSFTDNYQTFIIQSTHTMTTTGAFTISGTNTILQIAGTLNENNAITFTGATLQVDNGGRLNHNVNSALIFGGTESFGNTSTVNYGFAGTQTIALNTYGNLTLSGTSAKTFPAGTTTVNNILSMEGTATATITGTLTYGAAATLQYNTGTARTSGTEWITPFMATGGVIIANTGTITMNSAKVFNTNVSLTINSGAALATNNLDLTLGGNFVKLGTFSGGSSNIIINGTAATQNIDAFSVTGSVSMTKTGGTATFTGNVTASGLTINGTGGTLNLGAGFVHTFTGTWTRTNGTLNGGSSYFRIGGTVSGSGGTFTAGTGTVEWNASGAQTIANVTYNNISLNGSGTKTFPAAITINGYLAVGTGVVANLGTFTSTSNSLTLGGLGQTSGSWGSTSSPATNKNNTFFSATTGIVNVNSGSCTSFMSYGYERNITIDHSKVSGVSDLHNFPVLVNLTGQNFLMNVPTGQIFNTNGFDIIFTDENYNQLDHQLEYFNGTNGDLIAWIRIPNLSYSSNTVIKILYGNPQITTNPSVTTVWDSHYKGVWHLDNNSLNDFTSYNKAGTPTGSPTYPAGNIYNSLGLNGSSQFVEVNNDPGINFAGNITVSGWVYMNAGGRDQKIAGNQNNSSGGYKFGIYTNNKVEFEIRNAANTPSLNRDVTGGTTLNTGQWYYLAGISSDVLDSIKTFVNGFPERPFKKTGILGTASDKLTIGREPFISDFFFSGSFDEIRVSDEVRTDGWLRTEYNNQSSPSTFYSVDAAGVPANVLPSVSICSGPITLTFGYPAGGVYSGNTYISGNIFTPPSAGTYTILYTYNGACGPVSVTKDFIITAAPPAPAASNKEYCSNQITYLEATSGTNIRWYSGGTLVSTANPFSTGQTVPGTYEYTVTQTVNGCEGPATTVSLKIFGGITINTHPQPASICTSGSGTLSVSASGYNLTYQWQEAGVNITDGGIYSGATTPTLTLTNPGISKNGLAYRCVVYTTCGTSNINSNSAILTVTALPVASFSYAGTPYCANSSNPSPTFSGGGAAGTFSSTAGLVFVSTATGQVNLAASIPGVYTVTNTIAASGGCSVVTATSPITIISDLVWTGATSSDWNLPGNWLCGLVPGASMNVQIPNVTNKPVLSSGATGTIKNLVIDIGSSLTISGNKIQISGTITNNGTFTATNGAIELNGSAAQSIGSNVFSGNTMKDLIVNNTAGVSLMGALNVTGIVTVFNGNLDTGGNLTLISNAAGTALIDGSGAGTVTGTVTMQRYLASGFGYKYFSSPFQDATVNEFGDDMNLGSAFTSFYRYDENRTGSGWVNYKTTTNLLYPLAGYAVNFGSLAAPNTVDVTGTVTDGPLSVTLYNHNNTYTKGINLIGNPYPSPIDWDASSGWTKTNIDNALYYFKASATDQYGGTYSSYVNGMSSDGSATNIIPSMQGFMIHVSNGAYPVTGILGLTNSVRITDKTHSFLKSGGKGMEPLLRLKARYSDDTTSNDPVLIYIDDNATKGFESRYDALKMFNTDAGVPNLYIISTDEEKLSISGMPMPGDTLGTIPLGLKTAKDGDIIFRISDAGPIFSGKPINIFDAITGINNDLLSGNEYMLHLAAGDYVNRFYLNSQNIITGIPRISTESDVFTIYNSHGILKADIKKLQGGKGLIQIFNLIGQLLIDRKVFLTGYLEFNPGLRDGIYIVSYFSGNYRASTKIILINQ